MKWNNQLTNCNIIVTDLGNIIKMDLSKFDSSKVTDMRCMFLRYTSLISIDFKKLKHH